MASRQHPNVTAAATIAAPRPFFVILSLLISGTAELLSWAFAFVFLEGHDKCDAEVQGPHQKAPRNMLYLFMQARPLPGGRPLPLAQTIFPLSGAKADHCRAGRLLTCKHVWAAAVDKGNAAKGRAIGLKRRHSKSGACMQEARGALILIWPFL
jgi:hypothetical protein